MKHSPFEDLRRQLGLPESVATPDPEPEAPAPPIDAAAPSRAVVRYERSGRGGKEVTVVEQLGLSPSDLIVWLKWLKVSLGCGGAVEGPNLILQGDHRKRLPALLTQKGVRRVSVG